MAKPTWATDALGTALSLLGYSGHGIDALNQRANRDHRVVATTAFTAAVPSTATTGVVAVRTNLPAKPFFGRLVYDATLDEAYADIVASAIATGQRVVPSGTEGHEATGFCYEATDGGRMVGDDEPVWPTVLGETIEELAASTVDDWAADTVTIIGHEVVPLYADWTADAVKTIGAVVYPTVRNGYAYYCSGRSGDFKTHATTQPTWPLVPGEIVHDDKVDWTCFVPPVAVCTARAGDFKTDAVTQPEWPLTMGETVVDDQVTWTMRRLVWTTFALADEVVKVTDVVNGGGTTATLTFTRNARGLPIGVGTLVRSGLLTSHAAVTPFKAMGRYYALTAASPFVSYSGADAAALGKALNLYFGIGKGVGVRVYEMAKRKNYNLTLTVKE